MSTLDESSTTAENAIARLRALGREDLADSAITAAESRSGYDDIDANTTLSTQGKMQGYATRYAKVMSSLADNLTSATAVANRDYEATAASVFGSSGLRGDPHQLMFLARDADERVARAQTPEERQQLLNTAVGRNDQILSRAVAQAAVANGDAATAAAFQQHYPQHADAYEKVWDVARASNARIDPFTDKLWQRMHGLRPNTLHGRMGYEIDGIAATTQDA